MPYFKSINDVILEGSALLTKLFLASICYKVNPDLTMLMALFYVIHIVAKIFFMYNQLKQDEKFIKMLTDAVKRSAEEHDNDNEFK